MMNDDNIAHMKFHWNRVLKLISLKSGNIKKINKNITCLPGNIPLNVFILSENSSRIILENIVWFTVWHEVEKLK